MSFKAKVKHIAKELQAHIPFTAIGAVTGILFMLIFKGVGNISSHRLFIIFHPAHVVLSAMVTSSMFRAHTIKKRFLTVLLVGYFGSVGIATLSDIIIPHIGSKIFGLSTPTHAAMHQHTAHSTDNPESSENHTRKPVQDGHIHLGFIEDWYVVNPAALLGVLIAYFLPGTKFPHAGHVLIGTWASSSYLLMGVQSEVGIISIIGIFLTLFISTWLPCCISDIIFPLLLVKDPRKIEAHH